jgi:hypothetical protein
MSRTETDEQRAGERRSPDWGSYLLLVALLVLIAIVVVIVLHSSGDVASFFGGP